MSSASRSALGSGDGSVRTSSGYLSAQVRGASSAVAAGGRTASSSAPGQVFVDLLLLGALACQAPVALLSVPQPDGRWNTLTYGFDTRDGVNDGQLYEVLAAEVEAVELADLVTTVPRSPLVQPPHSMRWAYGVALRDETGSVLGVLAVLDRWLRQLTKREQRAIAAVGRQLAVQLVGLRRATSSLPASSDAGAGGASEGYGADRPSLVDDPLEGPETVDPAVGLQEPLVAMGPAVGPLGAGRPVGRDLRRRSATPSAGAPGLTGERHPLLRSQEVAELFDVTERTVINWAAAGKLPCLRTIGGHLRFRREDVMRLLTGAGG